MLHLHNVCKKLREHNLMSASVGVMLRTKDFRVSYLEEKLECMTNSEIQLTQIVIRLFDKLYSAGIVYRSCGVLAFSLADMQKTQLGLFVNEKLEKSQKLAAIIDRVENKYGKGMLLAGSVGIKSVQEKHKRELRFRSF